MPFKYLQAQVPHLKFVSQTLIVSPQAGGVEFDGVNLYITNNALVRGQLLHPSSSGVSGTVLMSQGAGQLPVWADTNSFATWLTNGSFVYYNTGNVGIGTNVPADKLDVSGTVRANDFKVGTQVVINSAGYVLPASTAVEGADCTSIGTGAIARNTSGTLLVCN